jgi:hypothetical protein
VRFHGCAQSDTEDVAGGDTLYAALFTYVSFRVCILPYITHLHLLAVFLSIYCRVSQNIRPQCEASTFGGS